MTPSRTHYERAFEDFLQIRQIPYVAVDQAKKAAFAGTHIKSFDFIVYPSQGPNLLVDVKGRKLPGSSFLQGRLGQNWTTAEDVQDLQRWQEIFGTDYRPAFVFAYWLTDLGPNAPNHHAHQCHGRAYVFIAAELAAYHRHMKPRSPRWRTVYVPARPFAQLAQPFDDFVRGCRPRSPDPP